MSEIMENISNETGKYKTLFDKQKIKGYNSCQSQIFDFFEKEIDNLRLERGKADDFDKAILSVLIGYLTMMQSKILDMECPE